MLAVACACSCGRKPQPADGYSERRAAMEQGAQAMLKQARAAMAASRCDEARTLIDSLRKTYYLALTAREQAILLMDSVNLLQAKTLLVKADSALRAEVTESRQADFDEACRKVQFYERKLRFDKSRSPRNKSANPAK